MARLVNHQAWIPQCWVGDPKPRSISKMEYGSPKQHAAVSANAAILRAMRK